MAEGMHKRIENAAQRAIFHIKSTGFDDVFKPPMFLEPIELQILRNNTPAVENYIRKETIRFLNCKDLHKCSIGKPRYFYFFKDHRSFRRVAWFDPLDIIKFTALSLMVVDEIEVCRIPAAENTIHSHRIAPGLEEIFTKDYGYDTFRAASAAKSKQYLGGYKIVTDISNFFDRINLHALENMLREAGCHSDFVTFLNNVLLHFAGGRASFGIPVGSDASRILSEAALLNVDKHLKEANVDFIRYVDDFRIFTNTRSQAHSHLLLLTTILHEEGLFLNYNKTSFIKITEDTTDPKTDKSENNPNRLQRHESIDINKIEKVELLRVTPSGHSRISKYYRKPGQEAINALRQLDKKAWVNHILTFDGFQEKHIRDGVKYFLYIEPDLALISHLIQSKISSIYYLADALVKDGDRLPPDIRTALVSLLLEELDYRNLCYPHAIPLVRILAEKNFLRQDVIMQIVRSFGLHDNPIFVREVLLLVSENLERSYIRTLAKDYFHRWPQEIKTAILYIVRNTKKLSSPEKDALVRDMTADQNDPIMMNM